MQQLATPGPLRRGCAPLAVVSAAQARRCAAGVFTFVARWPLRGRGGSTFRAHLHGEHPLTAVCAVDAHARARLVQPRARCQAARHRLHQLAGLPGTGAARA